MESAWYIVNTQQTLITIINIIDYIPCHRNKAPDWESEYVASYSLSAIFWPSDLA